MATEDILRFWILDFGFLIGDCRLPRNFILSTLFL